MNVRVKDFVKGDKLRRYMLMDNSADIMIFDFVVLKDGLLGLIKHKQMMCLDIADAERNLETMKIRSWKEIKEAVKEHGVVNSILIDNEQVFRNVKTQSQGDQS